MTKFRMERDSMGELQVPADALYGAQTQRAVQNFPISGHADAARVHPRAGPGQGRGGRASTARFGLLDEGAAAGDPCRRAGSRRRASTTRSSRSTSSRPVRAPRSNMNANEVIATLASRAGRHASPSQRPRQHRPESSNDVIPTAIQVSARWPRVEKLLPALMHLRRTIDRARARAGARWPRPAART